MVTTGWASLRVMVADDNAHMRGILVAMPKSIEVTGVYEAKDGRDAFDALQRWPADIAIVDFNMEPVGAVAFPAWSCAGQSAGGGAARRQSSRSACGRSLRTISFGVRADSTACSRSTFLSPQTPR